MVNLPTMLSPHDVAKILGVSYDSALAFVKYSGIDYVKVGKQYRISADKLQRFLAQSGRIEIDLTGIER